MYYPIFNKEEERQSYFESYEDSLSHWKVDIECLYIPTSFGNTYVIACGPLKASPLVLLHGMTMSSTMWFENAPFWSTQYRVYAIDIVGDFGKSECKKPISSQEDLVTWLNEVLDGLNVREVNLVGHSMGGWMALQYSLLTTRVKKLVLLAPVMSFAQLNWKFSLKLFPALMLKQSFFIKSLYKWMFSKQNSPSEVLYTQFYKGYKYGQIQLRMAPKIFERRELQGLTCETLLLIGEHEVVYSSIKKAMKHAGSIPSIITTIIPNCSHSLPAEQKDIVNPLVIDFLLK